MGIDLASQPAKTAICILRWGEGPPAVVALCRGRSDDGTPLHTKWLSTTAYGIRGDYGAPIAKVGIDAPFGWPEPFLDAVAAYRGGPSWPTGLDSALDACRLRETDRAVHRLSGKRPLSVSADKIAGPAMRCATLLTDIANHIGDRAVARDGSGLCCEVYPDPALRHWTAGMPRALGARESYKGSDAANRRRDLLAIVNSKLAFADSFGLLDRIVREDDYLDALVCALVARAVELSQTHAPKDGDERSLAEVEGWIHLPREPLEGLGTGKVAY